MNYQGSVIAVHPYPQYVDEGAFMEAGVELAEEFPVYGLEASNYNEESIVGDFYEDTLSEVENGMNGRIPQDEIRDLEPPFYVVGGLLNECIPAAVESLLMEGYDASVVEEGSFEKVGENEFMTYDEIMSSEDDFSSNLRNLYMIGAESVKLDSLV